MTSWLYVGTHVTLFQFVIRKFVHTLAYVYDSFLRVYHCGDVKWSSWRLELPVNPKFVQHFGWTDNNETSKVRVIVPLLGESTCDSPHKGTVTRKCFHLMICLRKVERTSVLCVNHWESHSVTLRGIIVIRYSEVMISTMASKITDISIVCSTGADQRKNQSSVSLTCVKGIHRWPVDSFHKGPVTRKVFPSHGVIIC